MTITSRGLRFTAFVTFVAFFAWLFKDSRLFTLFFVLLGIITCELSIIAVSAGKLSHKLRFDRDHIDLDIVAGRNKIFTVQVKSDLNLTLKIKPPIKWCMIEPPFILKGKSMMKWDCKPDLAGKYYTDNISVKVLGPLGLLETERVIPFNVKAVINPRVIPAMIRTIRFLAGVGVRGIGDEPMELRGQGLEYAETREYFTGDDHRRMDWMATARFGRLMVKTFHVEGESINHLSYDVRALGPKSKDELSTAFLSTALGLAQAERPFGLTIYDGEIVLEHFESLHHIIALRQALKYVLHTVEVDLEGINAVLDPRSSTEVRSMLRRLKDEPLRLFLDTQSKALSENTEEAHKMILQFVKRSEFPIRLTILTALTSDLTFLIELSRALKAKRGHIALIQPCKPWMEASTLEEAYELYERYFKAFQALRSRGVDASTSSSTPIIPAGVNRVTW